MESPASSVELCSDGVRHEQFTIEFGAPVLRVKFVSNDLYDAFGFEAIFQFLYNSRMNFIIIYENI